MCLSNLAAGIITAIVICWSLSVVLEGRSSSLISLIHPRKWSFLGVYVQQANYAPSVPSLSTPCLQLGLNYQGELWKYDFGLPNCCCAERCDGFHDNGSTDTFDYTASTELEKEGWPIVDVHSRLLVGQHIRATMTEG